MSLCFLVLHVKKTIILIYIIEKDIDAPGNL